MLVRTWNWPSIALIVSTASRAALAVNFARSEVTRPLGIDCPVLAWGLGLERLVMLNLGLNDIRHFYYGNDLKFLRDVKLWQ